MKRFFRLLAITLSILMILSVAAFAEADSGDLNNDGKVNDSDVLKIMDHIAKNGGYITAYDIRNDGTATINVLDAIALKSYVNGLVLNAPNDNWTTYWY